MSVIKVGHIVVFNEFVNGVEPEDEEGFIVLADTPDKSNTIPVKRLSDGDYQCLPLDYLCEKVFSKHYQEGKLYEVGKMIGSSTKALFNLKGKL